MKSAGGHRVLVNKPVHNGFLIVSRRRGLKK